jgi:hypothetical protein
LIKENKILENHGSPQIENPKASSLSAKQALIPHETPLNSSENSQPPSPNLTEADLLSTLQKNSQMNKAVLDQMRIDSKKFNNNLKLYLVINCLGKQQQRPLEKETDQKQQEEKQEEEEEDESLVCLFRHKYIVNNELSVSAQDCLCVFTSRTIIVFKVVGSQQETLDETSLHKLFVIDIDQIVTVEVSQCQSYLIVETAESGPSGRVKFVTLDVYLTQLFLSSLLKIINESPRVPMLKQIRKRNEESIRNVIFLIEPQLSETFDASVVELVSSIEELKIDETLPNFIFERRVYFVLIFNNERICLFEEDLNYFHQDSLVVKDTVFKIQFHLVGSAKINDIVNLELFTESDTKLEINFVDESRNSKKTVWSFNLSKPFLVGQLVTHLKSIWENIFFVELPINLESRKATNLAEDV